MLYTLMFIKNKIVKEIKGKPLFEVEKFNFSCVNNPMVERRDTDEGRSVGLEEVEQQGFE